MILKQLEYETVKQIYTEHLVKDFIPSEQKPLIVLQILMKMGLYRCYGAYEEDKLQGYAFFCESGSRLCKTALLDYLVVLDGIRGKGLGSAFLKLLRQEYQEYDFLIAEVERVEAGIDEKEQMIRKKRKDFYLKNDWKITGLAVDLFGSDLQIYQLPLQKNPKDDQVFNELNLIYDKMFYDKSVREKVILKK